MNIGIDFGTSYTKIGYLHNGKIINLLGEGNVIPSVVTYIPSTNKLYFGRLALRLSSSDSITAHYFKLELKRNLKFHLGEHSLQDILYQFFLYIKEEYVNPIQIPIESITISIPNYFGFNARNILLNAVKEAFLINNINMLPEPVAAIIGYNYNSEYPLTGDVLSIDIGGGTSDFSFLTIEEDNDQVILESQLQTGHDAFSGLEIDKGIIRHILFPAYKMQTGNSIPDELLKNKSLQSKETYFVNRILKIAESIKIGLTNHSSYYLNESDFFNYNSLVLNIDKSKYLSNIKPIYNRLEEYLAERVWKKADYLGLISNNNLNLDYILLVGGGSLALGVADIIKSKLKDVFLVIPQDREFNVLKGLCAYKSKEYDFSNIKSIYPFNFYIENYNKEKELSSLEKIPFDTKNLELDIANKYRLISLDKTSSFNISADENIMRFKIYELEEEEEHTTSTQRFNGQDIILDYSIEKNLLSDSLDIYLDFAESQIIVDQKKDELNNREQHLYFSDLIDKHFDLYNFMVKYKYSDVKLLQDHFNHLTWLENHADKQYNNQLTTTLYKLYAFLQIIKN